MPTPTKGARVGGSPSHERLIMANMATQLFTHDRVTTTEAKAKRLRPYAERLITFGKRGDLASRRRVMRKISDKSAVHRLFTEIAPDMAEREGGYTRITKIAPRKGDNAPMAVIERVREQVNAKPRRAVVAEAEAATRRSAADAATPVEQDRTQDEHTGATATDPAANGADVSNQDDNQIADRTDGGASNAVGEPSVGEQVDPSIGNVGDMDDAPGMALGEENAEK